MGYFSNGSEGADYHDQFCARCVHDINRDCPIWALHLEHNYAECNKPDSFLHDLIPLNGISNGQCKLFWEKAAIGDLFEAAP